MSSWDAALDAAGVRGGQLRADFSRQRRVVSRYRFAQYAAVRLLLPGAVVPHVVAATAFMHHTDHLLDQGGSLEERSAAYEWWVKQVRQALVTGRSEHGVLRAMSYTCGVFPQLAVLMEEFLGGTVVELDFAGFGTEEDYQRYVEAYSLPAFMVVAHVLAPGADAVGYRKACRLFIDGSQRLDFVNDLAEDLRVGRLNIPRSVLDRHGVGRGDLVAGRRLAGAGDLIGRELDEACACLGAGRAMVGYLPVAHRALGRALIGMEEATAEAARVKGAGLLVSSARPAVFRALGLLAREYRGRGRG
ncbi:squalene/phytoene synthase family protein [Streptomyces sp. NPDC005863]|uniref:squalene/phytoene synthase family protein n=1 Tax=unclassified Streptomyces TaxID=2593676 RepID=UPI0033D71EB3